MLQVGLHNTETVASLLGLSSSCHTRDISNAWIKRLTSKEMEMLQDYFIGTETPDGGDPFTKLGLKIETNWTDGTITGQKYGCVCKFVALLFNSFTELAVSTHVNTDIIHSTSRGQDWTKMSYSHGSPFSWFSLSMYTLSVPTSQTIYT